jgi:hypothetical protein
MNYLSENMNKTKLKDTRITQAIRFGTSLVFSLALYESLKSLEATVEEGTITAEDLELLKEMIFLTVENGPFTVGEA